MTRAFALLVLLGACAPRPVVTGGGAGPDGAAWFAVTQGEELTFYRCEPSGCVAVPRTRAAVLEPAWESESEPGSESESGSESEPESESESESEERDGPEEERLDLMNGVI